MVQAIGELPTPTDEQCAAVQLFEAGGNLKIQAFAGTGKTMTLRHIARKSARPGFYLAFNKAIVEDARRNWFPPSVECRTCHSLAFRALLNGHNMPAEKLKSQLNAKMVVTLLQLNDRVLSNRYTIRKETLAHLVMRSLRRYMHSSDEELKLGHVSDRAGVGPIPAELLQPIRTDLLKTSKELWLRMCDPKCNVPLGSDGYLKLWALQKPQIGSKDSYILLDEAQDSNPVLLDVLQSQPAQVIYVGDKHQQIYEWRGAVNAMERTVTPHSTYLTHSFRFGDRIASLATWLVTKYLGENREIHGARRVAKANGDVTSEAILCRTNAGVIEHLNRALLNQKKVHILGGSQSLTNLLNAVVQLKKNRPSYEPEFFGFANWNEVVEFAETEAGEHLGTFVRLVGAHGEAPLLESMKKTTDSEKDADIVISTVHKAKGREWDKVTMADDFAVPKFDGNMIPTALEDVRLLYVAVTRAKSDLRIPSKLRKLLDEQNRSSAPFPMKDRPPTSIIATPRLPRNDDPPPKAIPQGAPDLRQTKVANAATRTVPRDYAPAPIRRSPALAQSGDHTNPTVPAYEVHTRRLRDQARDVIFSGGFLMLCLVIALIILAIVFGGDT